ncbi:MAG: alpha-L-fucosidase [Cyclobacteriaceae bacterium]
MHIRISQSSIKYLKTAVVLGCFLILYACNSDQTKEEPIVEVATPLPMSNVDAFIDNHEPHSIALPYETKEAYEARMQWWKDAKYGMFIHWGLYSILAGEYKGEITPRIAEWIQRTLEIPLSEYQKLVQQFNPTKFDAEQWVSIAKSAGMKYMILTSKHHDGFALFDSEHSEYDVMSTPFNRDIVMELKDACRAQGLKFGLYYSHTIDWEHPHAYLGEGKLVEQMNTLDHDPKLMDRSIYLEEKSYPQLREILTNYGDIDVIWFDMGAGLSNDEIREFVKITREFQPNIIISSRIGGNVNTEVIDREMLFDFYTPSDNYFTGDDLAIPWEMAGTTNGSWGYRNDDHEWRSPDLILNSLAATASRNGNYLLNVGPMADGLIPSEPVKNLLEAGKWLETNGASIYNTTGSPFPWNYDWGYITEKSGKLFLNVFNWPTNGSLVLNGLVSKVTKVSVLGSSASVGFKQEGRFVTIDVAGIVPDDLATTFVVEYDGGQAKVDHSISQSLDNTIQLDRIAGNYYDELSLTTWDFYVHQPGTFKMEVRSNEKARHSNPKWVGSDQQGSIQVAGKVIPLELSRDSERVNPSLFFYKEITSNAGTIELTEKGTYSLQLKGIKVNPGKWKDGLGLSSIRLVPVKQK